MLLRETTLVTAKAVTLTAMKFRERIIITSASKELGAWTIEEKGTRSPRKLALFQVLPSLYLVTAEILANPRRGVMAWDDHTGKPYCFGVVHKICLLP